MAKCSVVAICPKGHDVATEPAFSKKPTESILKEGAPVSEPQEPAEPMENIVIDLAEKFMRIYCNTCGTWYDVKIVVGENT